LGGDVEVGSLGRFGGAAGVVCRACQQGMEMRFV
jgi:hypothetical protein